MEKKEMDICFQIDIMIHRCKFYSTLQLSGGHRCFILIVLSLMVVFFNYSFVRGSLHPSLISVFRVRTTCGCLKGSVLDSYVASQLGWMSFSWPPGRFLVALLALLCLVLENEIRVRVKLVKIWTHFLLNKFNVILWIYLCGDVHLCLTVTSNICQQ